MIVNDFDKDSGDDDDDDSNDAGSDDDDDDDDLVIVGISTCAVLSPKCRKLLHSSSLQEGNLKERYFLFL